MIQFLVLLSLVFWGLAYFLGIDKALQISPKVMDYWFLAGVALLVLSFFTNFLGGILFLFKQISRLFRRKSP